jgi:hypothetical protein
MKKFLLLSCCVVMVQVKAQWVKTPCLATQINAVAAMGTNVYAGTAGGSVTFSYDGGTIWTFKSPSGFTYPYVWALMAEGTTLYAASQSGFYISSDSAKMFVQKNTGLGNDSVVFCLMRSGTDLFIGTTGGVYKSNNNGTNWTKSSAGITSADVKSLAKSGTTLLAGTSSGGVFISSDNGASWTSSSAGITGGNVQALTVNGSVVFAGTFGNGVYTSTNNGVSWTAASTGLINQNITSMFTVSNTVFCGSGGGVFVSNNNGMSWTAENTGLTSSNISSFAVAGGDMFIGVQLSGVWKRPLSQMLSPVVTNVQQFIDQKMTVFPNPSSGNVFVKDIEPGSELTVTTLDGRVVYRATSDSEEILIHEASLLPGVYFISVVKDQNLRSRSKLVISVK